MSIKILVADDSITIQKVIGIIFGGDEFALTVVDNGKAAVDKAREINPDILLIDALMPGMTGYEVAEAVRSTPSLATKPILLLTGSFEPFDEDKAKKCGADDFIAKPFESQQIITKVKELLETAKSRIQTMPQQAPQQSAPESAEELSIDFSTPVNSEPAQVFTQETSSVQTEAPADIWGAFTTETEQPSAAVAAPVIPPPAAPTVNFEPDVFAIVSEDDDAQLVKTAVLSSTSPQHTGSQWIPVEENTFEFEEEVIATPPPAAFPEQTVPVQEASFGDIAFTDEVKTPVTPIPTPVQEETFTEPEPVISAPDAFFTSSTPSESVFETTTSPAPIVEPFAPLADPVPVFAAPVQGATPVVAAATDVPPAAVPASLTEEQLKAALAGVSKDIIERIVWEVVPDLAEALIREAIRKIKDGI